MPLLPPERIGKIRDTVDANFKCDCPVLLVLFPQLLRQFCYAESFPPII